MNAPRSPGARVLVFNLVGVFGFVLQLGVLWLLVHVFRIPVLPATALAVEAAVLHNFLWHRRWTWSDRTRVSGLVGCLLRFNLANGAVSLLVNVALMAVLNVVLPVPYLLANTVAVCCASAANYVLGDRVVFPTRSHLSPTPLYVGRQNGVRGCGGRG